jgi:hypothetical protein
MERSFGDVRIIVVLIRMTLRMFHRSGVDLQSECDASAGN